MRLVALDLEISCGAKGKGGSTPLSIAAAAGQLEAVQARLRVLHKAQLLSDEEQHRVEDTVADCIVNMAMGAVATSAVIQLVRLSEWMADDRSFARQLQRKF